MRRAIWPRVIVSLILMSMWTGVVVLERLDSQKEFEVESFFNQLPIKRIVCFNSTSGIVCKCDPEDLGKVEECICSEPKNQIVGIIIGPTNYLLFLEYSRAKNKLEAYGAARNIKYCKELFPGKVLQEVLKEIMQETSGLSTLAEGLFLN